MEQKKQSYVRHILIVVTCCLIMMSGTGMVFSVSGIFYTPICTEFGIGRGQASLWVTIALLVAFVCLPFVGSLFNKGNRKWLICLAALLVGGGQLVFSAAKSIIVFYICAVFIGFGMTILGYVSVPGLINRWFKKRSGLLIGICVAFSGVGGAIYNPIASALINNQGWRTGYVVMGLLAMIQVIPITLLVVRDDPSDVGLKAFGEEDAAPVASESPAPTALTGVSASKAMKTTAFWMVLIFAGVCSFGSSIYQYMPSYATSLPVGQAAPALAATLASVVMVSQAIGKVSLGYVSDWNPYVTIILSVVCGLAGLLMMWLCPYSTVLVYIAGFLFGIYYSTSLVVVPALARRIFGLRDFDKIYSRFTMIIAIAAAFSVTLMGFMVDGTGGYTVLWVLGIVLIALELICGFGGLAAAKKLKWTEK